MIDQLRYTKNEGSLFQILNHLKRANLLFQPPLGSYINLEEYSHKLFSKAFRFEVFIQSQLIGLVAVYFSEKQAFISNFSIEKEWLGQGISNELMQIVFNESVCKNVNSIILEVFKENKRAIRFYFNRGFVLEKDEGNVLTLVKVL